MDLHDVRRSYEQGVLRRSELHGDPMVQFAAWFENSESVRQQTEALASHETHVFTLSTVDAEGAPSSRSVLLKTFGPEGFVFYTNCESAKAREINRSDRVSLHVYWPWMERQVRVQGRATRVSGAQAEAYHRSRPRDSQLSTWASAQSDVVPDRDTLDRAWREAEMRFEGRDVPLMPAWGGYVVAPTRLEFWQGRKNRLHDRFRYQRDANGEWAIDRLAP